MKPQLGQPVHWVGFDGECVAAIVTEVQAPGLPDHVSLTIFPPATTTILARTAKYDAERKPSGTWHLPEPPTQDMDLTA